MTLHSNKVKAKIIKSTFACQRDGLTIRGTEYRQERDCLTIAIVSHGFMAFQDTVRQYAVVLAEMGYVSYCFDFCGGCVIKGKSDGSTAEMFVLYYITPEFTVLHWLNVHDWRYVVGLLGIFNC